MPPLIANQTNIFRYYYEKFVGIKYRFINKIEKLSRMINLCGAQPVDHRAQTEYPSLNAKVAP